MSLRPKKVDFDEKWAFLADCFGKTLTMKGTDGVFGADVRLAVYQLCECFDPHPFCEELYYAIKDLLEAHVRAEWEKYVIGTGAIESLVHFLDSNWVRDVVVGDPNAALADCISPSILDDLGDDLMGASEYEDVFFFEQLAVNSWTSVLFSHVQPRLSDEMLQSVRDDRLGVSASQSLPVRLRECCVALGQPKQPLEVYQQCFEAPYLQDLRAFYQVEASNYIMANGILSFLQKARDRLMDEEQRCVRYLDPSSLGKARAACDQVLVAGNAPKIYAEIQWMLEHEETGHLAAAFALLSRLEEGVRPLQEQWQAFILFHGRAQLASLLPSNEDEVAMDRKHERGRGRVRAVEYVEELITVYEKLRGMVDSAFAGSSDFASIMYTAFRDLMAKNAVVEKEGKDPHFTPERLAGYLDYLLGRKAAKSRSEADLEKQMVRCIDLFKLVDDKDVFRKYYANFLAHRLIEGNCASEYLEQQVLVLLQEACGFDYTAKLQKMLQDMKLASGVTERFKRYLAKLPEEVVPAFDFSTLVLTTASWPLVEQKTHVSLPLELVTAMQTFSRFYETEHSGRKLTWLHNSSKGDISLHGFRKPHVISMPTYMMAVIMHFNDAPSHSYAALKQMTNLSDGDLKRCLLHLTKCKLLLARNPASGREDHLATTSVFRVNESFAFRAIRFKLLPHGPQTSKVKAAVDQRIHQDRGMYLQAAIVRVMKHRKQLGHEALVAEVLAQTRMGFRPSVSAIKRSVEQLIEKDFLERSPSEPGTYRYLA